MSGPVFPLAPGKAFEGGFRRLLNIKLLHPATESHCQQILHFPPNAQDLGDLLSVTLMGCRQCTLALR